MTLRPRERASADTAWYRRLETVYGACGARPTSKVDDARVGMRGQQGGRRAHADDALAAHGEPAVGQHRRRYGQHPVATVDRDVVADGSHGFLWSRHARRGPI